jgi:hypothetical protein
MASMKRLMSDAALERLTADVVEDLFWKGNLSRSDVARWIEQVQADSGRLYEPVYNPRRVRGKLGDSVWLKRRDDLEAERGVGDSSPGHSTKKSAAQLNREIAQVLASKPRHHATKKSAAQIEPLPHNREWHHYIVGQGGELLERYKGQDIHRNGIAHYVNGLYVGTSLRRAKEYVRNTTQGHSTKKQSTKALDPAKAYNAHRLEEEFGGVWHSGADAQGYQDHWMETPDGTVWRPRVPHHYYSQASGKLMMVVSHRVLPKPEARWR